MAIHRLSSADIQMAIDMFDASPNGAAERERLARLVEALPSVSGEFSGHWCQPDCDHWPE